MRFQLTVKLQAAALVMFACMFGINQTAEAQLLAKLKSACVGGSECDECYPIGPCRSCNKGGDCAGCNAPNFGEGAPCGMDSYVMGGGASYGADCGCDDNSEWSSEPCDTCFSGLFGGLSRLKSKIPRGPATGMSRFEAGAACSSGKCGSKIGGRLGGKLGGGVAQASYGGCDDGSCGHAGGLHAMGGHFRGKMASHAGHLGGCGRMGCGYGGRPCSKCQRRYSSGVIPHLQTPNGGAYGSGGQMGTYAYPYYTTRGPRDFLQDGCGGVPMVPYNPKKTCLPSIGW